VGHARTRQRAVSSKDRADSVKVPAKPTLTRGIELIFHPYAVADFSTDWQLLESVVVGDSLFQLGQPGGDGLQLGSH